MSAAILQSGITPKLTLDAEIKEAAERLGKLIAESALGALERIRQAESSGVERLNEYVPTERLLDLREAAAYLNFKPRSLDQWTRGAKPLVQFRMLGGQKRFRMKWLNEAIDNGSVKPRECRV